MLNLVLEVLGFKIMVIIGKKNKKVFIFGL